MQFISVSTLTKLFIVRLPINLYVFSRSDKIEVSFFRPGKEEGGWIYLQTNILDMPSTKNSMDEVIFSKEERWWVKKKLVELSPLVLIDVTGCWLTVNSALVKEARCLLPSSYSPATLPFSSSSSCLSLSGVFLPYHTTIFFIWGQEAQPLRPLEASQSDRKERSSKMKMMLLLPPQLVVAIFLVLLRSGKTNGHIELLLMLGKY